MRIKIKTLKMSNAEEQFLNQTITVKGWVRTVRHQKKFSFIEINDGSSLSGFQIIADSTLPNYNECTEEITTGASLSITGNVVKSPGKGQSLELNASEITIIGKCDSETFPLQKKRHSFEFLRTIAHLRPRTNTIGAVSRIRNRLAYATHNFYQEQDFFYVNTPILTVSDCEGAGEMFRATTIQSTQKPEEDFFGKMAYLTVSGQLNAEIYASAMSDVYTFGPTFRSENSNTSRHLAEFWMIEPEIAFANLADDMDLAENYLRYLLLDVLKECKEDMEFFNKFIDKGIIKRLTDVSQSEFKKISYEEAVFILEKSSKNFKFPVGWGLDLQSEHERYLTEEHFKQPVIIYNYPKTIKAFYMRDNDDGKTVAAMDVLVPQIGEIIGGSQREERYDILESKIKAMNLNPEDYWWYLDLRRYGSVPHAGFGLGFERLVQFVTGMENIRDVIPFPRYPGHADF
jgi:asparaginyl-tRNA synthetase